MNQITPIVPAADAEPSSELEIFDRRYKPADLFIPGAFDPVLAHIREVVTSELYDATTKEGRERIKSQAFKVTKTKTAIDAARKALVSAEKQRLAKIDAEGKRMWDALEALAEEVKAPATEFENREKDRIAGHEAAMTALKALLDFPPLSAPTVAELERRIATATAFDPTALEEFAALAATVRQHIVESLTATLAERQKAEAEAAELARLRAAEEARQQQEQEAEIARKAAETAQAEAAEAVARAEREKVEAEERAAKAEQDRIAAEEKHEANKQAAVKSAVLETLRREEEAAERERLRLAAEKRQEEEAARQREADISHKRRINTAAMTALAAAGLSEDAGKLAIAAIAKGQIPHITIAY